MDLAEEKKLIQKARKDPNAFGEIFDKHYSHILNYTLKRVADAQLAEDITAEVFFKAFQKLWQFRWNNIPFIAWLFRIANNEIKMHFRKQKYAPLSLERAREKEEMLPINFYDLRKEIAEAEKVLEEKEDLKIIQSSLMRLPIIYQEVLALKFLEMKKISEIAVILKKREGTIKSLLSRGLKLWKKEVMNKKQTQHYKTLPAIKNSNV